MKRFLTLCCLIGLYVCQSTACTNFIVGKKASVDGSVICSYNADDYGMFQYLCHYPAGKHEKGENSLVQNDAQNNNVEQAPQPSIDPEDESRFMPQQHSDDEKYSDYMPK